MSAGSAGRSAAGQTIAAPRAPYVMAVAGILLAASIFVALAQSGEAAGWIVAGFFVACALAAAVPIVRRDRLLLTDAGLRFRVLGVDHAVAWSDVEAFAVVRRGVREAVGMRFVPGRAVAFPARLVRASERYPNVLPSTFGMPAEDLVELLESRRARAASS